MEWYFGKTGSWNKYLKENWQGEKREKLHSFTIRLSGIVLGEGPLPTADAQQVHSSQKKKKRHYVACTINFTGTLTSER